MGGAVAVFVVIAVAGSPLVTPAAAAGFRAPKPWIPVHPVPEPPLVPNSGRAHSGTHLEAPEAGAPTDAKPPAKQGDDEEQAPKKERDFPELEGEVPNVDDPAATPGRSTTVPSRAGDAGAARTTVVPNVDAAAGGGGNVIGLALLVGGGVVVGIGALVAARAARR